MAWRQRNRSFELSREVTLKPVFCLENGKDVQQDNTFVSMNPILDENGLLRVGGRLRHASTPLLEKMPIIIRKKSHIAILLVRHFHA